MRRGMPQTGVRRHEVCKAKYSGAPQPTCKFGPLERFFLLRREPAVRVSLQNSPSRGQHPDSVPFQTSVTWHASQWISESGTGSSMIECSQQV